jgi:hypothetical protein
MNIRSVAPNSFRLLLVLLSLALGATLRAAEPDSDDPESTGLEITVGITPTCPYGMTACWQSAAQSIAQLETVQKVAAFPDAYNCTAQVWLKQGAGLPDLKKWHEHFKAMVGESYVFRGLEATLAGTLEQKEGLLYLQSQALDQPVRLMPFKDKLQWNFLKQRARGPEEDERTAYQQLEASSNEAKDKPLEVRVTGPIQNPNGGTVLEVREFFTLTPYKYVNHPY